MTLEFQFKRPKSHFTKKGSLTKRAPHFHVQVPDCDNLAKHVMDALNGRVFLDDKQVCQLTVCKEWSNTTDATRVTIVNVGVGDGDT